MPSKFSSRRKFLKTTSFIALGALLLPTNMFTEEKVNIKSDMPKDGLKKDITMNVSHLSDLRSFDFVSHDYILKSWV